MPPPEIPPEVTRFISDHIKSVDQLETLLLLHRTPNRDWTAEQVAAELRTSTDAAKLRLADLKTLNFLAETQSSAFRFSPSNSEAAKTISALAQLYQTRRVSIITMIYSKPVDGIRAFSDAFKIKKEGK